MESPFAKEWDKKIIVRIPSIRLSLLDDMVPGLKILLIMIKSILRIHAEYLKPITLYIRQFW